MIRSTIGLLILGMLPLAAQTTSLQGVVTDPQGAIVTAAIVTITNTATSVARKEVTDETGTYRFAQVVPGPYTLEVQKPGFTTKVSSVTLQVDLPVTLNLALEVGKTSDVVNVSAESTTINTENATVGNPFTEQQIESLPLQTRNVVALMSLQAGVTSNGNVVGSPSGQNYVTVDGADVNGFTGTGGFNSAVPIPLDSVQEFRTVVTGEGADLGRGSGGQAQVVTKSGTNQFHGGLYEFNRNTDFEADDWFSNKAGVTRPALIRNQYGGTIGGPIKKNKLFFFYNFEGRKDRSQTAAKATVPSSTFRQGLVELLEKGQTIANPTVLTPAQVQQIDPLGIGENPYVLQQMQLYPQGNDPSAASDKGLNFNTLLFNTPVPYNDHTQVGKLDYTINSRMTVSLRGTLDGSSTSNAAQFPGQGPASVSLGNPRGLAARYTYVISASLVNSFNYGYTRSSSSGTGNLNVIPSYGFTPLSPSPRESQSFSPVQSYNDDLTKNHGRHTLQFGVAWHHADTTSNSFSKSEPSYSFGSGVLLGLGVDITGDVTAFLQKTNPTAALNSTANVISAFGAVFGLLNSGSATYNYNLQGQAVPFGQPVQRSFATSSPEFYGQDSWKAKPNLTLIYGLRYSIYGVPYETGGIQVTPTIPVNEFFAQRQAAATYGVPDWADPDALITYAPGGPKNNAAGYYPTTYNDLAPRVGFAYQPKGELEKVLGKGSVIRGSYSIVYDNYGNDLASSLASGGTPGLITNVANPVNLNFSTAPRYDGTGATLPAITPPVAGTAFPYTPPISQGGFTEYTEVSGDLKAPYEHVISLTYARPLPKHMSIEVGYAGRLSHRALVTQDYGQPLAQFTDTVSGQEWQQAAGVLENLYAQGLTTAQVKANPGMVPLQPFIQNVLPAAANQFITGSASANVFYEAFAGLGGSWTDTLNEFDRIHLLNSQTNTLQGCLSKFGCNTFFAEQAPGGVETTTNSGQAAYNALLVSLRRTLTHGWGYDFNYTWSHAIDDLGNIQNAFIPTSSLGPSGYDMRHQINANFTVEIPVGRGKALGGNMPRWADNIVGGWVVSSLYTFHTGGVVNCSSGSGSGIYNVNYESSSLCELYPGITQPARAFQFDQLGIPSMYANTNEGSDFVPAPAGVAGYNGLARGLSFWDLDSALNKNFRLPKEGMQLTLRVEAYNIFNKQEFNAGNVSIGNLPGSTTTTGLPAQFGSSTFGEITSSSSTPRVLQVNLRFRF